MAQWSLFAKDQLCGHTHLLGHSGTSSLYSQNNLVPFRPVETMLYSPFYVTQACPGHQLRVPTEGDSLKIHPLNDVPQASEYRFLETQSYITLTILVLETFPTCYK